MKVALDVMGGDRAPDANLQGALLAVENNILAAEELLLVGQPELIAAGLVKLGGNADSFTIQPASQVVEMGENPAEALRKKPDSSILVSAKTVLEKKVGAMVSAGHTGAAVACAVRLWRTLPDIRRPGIAATFTGGGGKPVTVIDMGANLSCTPKDLLNYAYMATAYAQDALDTANPQVGLMNIGAEDAKGNQLTKETHALFSTCDLNFIGNVEGGDVFTGACDVIVCEGFVGNVILKLCEGLSAHLMRTFDTELQGVGVSDEIRHQAVQRSRKSTDYSEYGGALLLGVDGICVIGHGHSDAKAIANAIRIAVKTVDKGLNEHIGQAINKHNEKSGDQGSPART